MTFSLWAVSWICNPDFPVIKEGANNLLLIVCYHVPFGASLILIIQKQISLLAFLTEIYIDGKWPITPLLYTVDGFFQKNVGE